jgi:hypothetical protein
VERIALDGSLRVWDQNTLSWEWCRDIFGVTQCNLIWIKWSPSLEELDPKKVNVLEIIERAQIRSKERRL